VPANERPRLLRRELLLELSLKPLSLISGQCVDQRSERCSAHARRRRGGIRPADLEFDYFGIDTSETGLYEKRPDDVDPHREGLALERSWKRGFCPGGGQLIAVDTKRLERVPTRPHR
jgi:hypothetical protein